MINIVCALHCEARPIIDFYQLTAKTNGVFPVYSNDSMNLVVSGIGKVDVAAAMAYLFVKTQERKNNAWLNYGIAGHKTAPLGAWFNINKITEVSSSLNWYPSRFKSISCQTASLKTVDIPVSLYDAGMLYDMESSAFMATALKFSSIELIQIMKVVSDNEENHLLEINKKQVETLLKDNISEVINIVNVLHEKIAQYDSIYGEDDVYLDCLKKWHFTQYQKKEVERLIQRWRLMANHEHLYQLDEFRDAKQVIAWFKEQLEDVDVAF